MCLCPGWEREDRQRGGGQRRPHLCRVSRRLLQSIQLSALRSRLLRALSPHSRQEQADKHTLSPVSLTHLTHQLPQRCVSLWTPLFIHSLLHGQTMKSDLWFAASSCWDLWSSSLIFTVPFWFLTRAQPHSKDLLPKSLLHPQAELPECLVCKMASSQFSQTFPLLLGWENVDQLIFP